MEVIEFRATIFPADDGITRQEAIDAAVASLRERLEKHLPRSGRFRYVMAHKKMPAMEYLLSLSMPCK